jgi:hypothetical protein
VLVFSLSAVAAADGQIFINNGFGQLRSSYQFSMFNSPYLNIAPQPYSRFNPYYAPVYVPGYAPYYYQRCAPVYQPAFVQTWNPGYRW